MQPSIWDFGEDWLRTGFICVIHTYIYYCHCVYYYPFSSVLFVHMGLDIYINTVVQTIVSCSLTLKRCRNRQAILCVVGWLASPYCSNRHARKSNTRAVTSVRGVMVSMIFVISVIYRNAKDPTRNSNCSRQLDIFLAGWVKAVRPIIPVAAPNVYHIYIASRCHSFFPLLLQAYDGHLQL